MGPDFLKVPEMRFRGRIWEGRIQFAHLRPQWLCILLLKVAEQIVRHPRRIRSVIVLHDCWCSSCDWYWLVTADIRSLWEHLSSLLEGNFSNCSNTPCCHLPLSGWVVLIGDRAESRYIPGVYRMPSGSRKSAPQSSLFVGMCYGDVAGGLQEGSSESTPLLSSGVD